MLLWKLPPVQTQDHSCLLTTQGCFTSSHTYTPSSPHTSSTHARPLGFIAAVRAFRSVGGNPIVFDRVKGPYCWDVDGNKYIDYIGSWGPAIVGAANDEVNEALKAQIEKGTSFGAPSALEVSCS